MFVVRHMDESSFFNDDLPCTYGGEVPMAFKGDTDIWLHAAVNNMGVINNHFNKKEQVKSFNKKYISKNKDKLIQTAPDDVVIIRYITDNKLLKLADVDRYLEEGILSVEAKVLLLQYRENNFTDKQKIADFEKL